VSFQFSHATHNADFLHISAKDLHPAMLGCSTDARQWATLLVYAILGEEFWIRVKYYKNTVLPPSPPQTHSFQSSHTQSWPS